MVTTREVERWLIRAVIALTVAASALDVRAQESAITPANKGGVSFVENVLPILRDRCHKCHGGVHREGELSLLTRHDATTLLPSGTVAIVPGEPDASEVWRRITAHDPAERMPPAGEPLTAAELRILRHWIDAGANWELHWSYRPIEAVLPPPVIKMHDWPRNQVDHFVLNRLIAAELEPSGEADRSTLIRRLYLDLLGLPPSIEEVDAFCSDTRPDAYARIVDQLLASPHFGERWGRHWLDQARYADTDGFEVDGPRPTAWRWRDWVIEAWNEDMPFDQFSLEQIAGDLLSDATPRQRLATGFQRQSLTNKEGGIDQQEARYKELVDRVNAVGTIWLGMTIGCAQCHNHPYDPLTQREFFQLYAFFNQTDDTELTIRSSDEKEEARNTESSEGKKARNQRGALVVSQTSTFRPTTLYHRGDFLQPAETVPPGVFSALHSLKTGSASSATPDRLDLARWIIDQQNPLTARVAANQVWVRLFGAGLVRTADDFGAHGEPPGNPLLLDWLADEYRIRGWSTKQLIRTIVTSATYRQSSKHRPELESIDPLNELWHRQNRYRVEAEVVHDLNLAAAGLLTARIGGPSFFPPLAEEVAKLSFRSNYVWKESTGGDRYRRGMYIYYKRTLPHPNLDAFDCPDATTARMQREISNNPLQALVTLNNEVFWEAAQSLARHVGQHALRDDRSRIIYLFRRCLGRDPTDSERQTLEQLLLRVRDEYRTRNSEARLLIGNDLPGSVDPADAAAWVAACNVVLNMDEFLTRE